jgi:hypothetical protein
MYKNVIIWHIDKKLNIKTFQVFAVFPLALTHTQTEIVLHRDLYFK